MTSLIAQPLNLSLVQKELNLSWSAEQLELLPTEEDVAFFQEHGWFITKKVFSDKLIDKIYEVSQEFYEGIKDANLPYKDGYGNWQKEDGGTIRNNEHISLQKKAFCQLTLNPIIGAIAAKITKTLTIRLFQDQLVSKEPFAQSFGGKVGWHTDKSYVSNSTSNKLLAAWIPLHDVTEEQGPLVVVDRSHKWTGNEHMRSFNQDNHDEIEAEYAKAGREFKKIPIVLKKGQISFHHGLLVHGSYPNCSHMLRRAMVMHLQDADNRYQEFWNNGKQIHHFLDRLCRKQPNGLPDYTDPAIFPILWSENNQN